MTPPTCITKRNKFDVIRLTAEQVKRNVLPGDFDESKAMKFSYDPYFELWHEIDPKTKKRSDKGVLKVMEMGFGGMDADFSMHSEGYTFISNVSLNDFRDNSFRSSALLFIGNRSVNVNIRYCAKRGESLPSAVCSGASQSIKQEFSTYLVLSGRTYVQSANFGDYNADGLTDILLTLSDGGAYIFQQREKTRKVKVCEDDGDGIELMKK